MKNELEESSKKTEESDKESEEDISTLNYIDTSIECKIHKNLVREGFVILQNLYELYYDLEIKIVLDKLY